MTNFTKSLTRGNLLTVAMAFCIVPLSLFTDYLSFLDPTSVLIVFGGTFISGIISYDPPSISKALKESWQRSDIDQLYIAERVAFFSDLSQVMKRNGIFVLEKYAHQEEDPLLRKGLQLVADGSPIDEIRHILQTDTHVNKSQKTTSVEILFYLASVAPAAGLIGTVIGLIFMLADVENSSQLSSGMSIALLTTLYGAVLSYLVLQPLATRLEKRIKDEEMLQRLSIEGILALSKGTNPQLMQERLEAFAG